MVSYAGHDELKGADPKMVVGRDSNVVFPSLLRGQAHVAAHLSRYFVSIAPESVCKVVARDVTG